ncbi:MAG: sigma-70 family RNA polymerase sigma factor [Lachnospiraceae bacterium]|nr:sigma-70 family RNA polymerase sigma factor [Lachnospiraceae bacterium]
MNYDEIADKYVDIVYRTALSYCKNKEDAEDVVQNTFVKLLRTNPDFSDEKHIRHWLIRVAINECKDIWKSFWRKNVTSIELLECDVEAVPNEQKDLFESVMKLPSKYSIVLHLYYYEGYHVNEIAALLNISETNVQTRLMRARKQLKLQLKEDLE